MSRDLFLELTTYNTQFDDVPSSEPVFNHEACALLVAATIGKKHRQTYVLAGPEDLRALVPKLELDQDGQEALILIRPYIHVMGLYFRREEGKLKVFIFDSQNWGVKYQPTRLIISAIQQYYNNAEIVLSGTELQSQSNQRGGCTRYALAFLRYCSQHGANFFQNYVTNAQDVDNFPGVKQQNENQLPTELLNTKNNAQWVSQNYHDDRRFLTSLLQDNYQQDGALNRNKVMTTVRAMQGCDMPFNLIHAGIPLYNISLSSDGKSLTIHLPKSYKPKFSSAPSAYSDFYLYNNCLTYSKVLYPSDVKANSNLLISLLADVPGITIIYNDNAQTFTIKAEQPELLIQAFKRLNNASEACVLYANHLRQLGALAQLYREVELVFEVSRICQDGKGGLTQHQVLGALTELLQARNDVYVPRTLELSANSGLPVAGLCQEGYRYIALSCEWNSDDTVIKHQVGICIEITDSKPVVHVFDSKNYGPIPKALRETLSRLLGREDFNVKLESCCFETQADDWSCGVHAVANIVRFATNTPAPTTLSKLDVKERAELYCRLNQSNELRQQALCEQRRNNTLANKQLLDTIEICRAKQGYFANKNQESGDVLKPLADNLQMLNWGNRDRGNSPDNNIGRSNTSNDALREHNPVDILSHYIKTHPKDAVGVKLCNVYILLSRFGLEGHWHQFVQLQNQQTQQMLQQRKTRNLIQYVLGELESNSNVDNKQNYYCGVIQRILTAAPGSRMDVIAELISGNGGDLNEIISGIMKLLSGDSEQNRRTIIYIILELLVERVVNHHSYRNDADARLSREEQARMKAKHDAEAQVIGKLKLLGVSDLPVADVALISEDVRKLSLMRLIDEAYFSGVSVQGRKQFFVRLAMQSTIETTLNNLVLLCPNLEGKKFLAWVSGKGLGVDSASDLIEALSTEAKIALMMLMINKPISLVSALTQLSNDRSIPDDIAIALIAILSKPEVALLLAHQNSLQELFDTLPDTVADAFLSISACRGDSSYFSYPLSAAFAICIIRSLSRQKITSLIPTFSLLIKKLAMQPIDVRFELFSRASIETIESDIKTLDDLVKVIQAFERLSLLPQFIGRFSVEKLDFLLSSTADFEKLDDMLSQNKEVIYLILARLPVIKIAKLIYENSAFLFLALTRREDGICILRAIGEKQFLEMLLKNKTELELLLNYQSGPQDALMLTSTVKHSIMGFLTSHAFQQQIANGQQFIDFLSCIPDGCQLEIIACLDASYLNKLLLDEARLMISFQGINSDEAIAALFAKLDSVRLNQLINTADMFESIALSLYGRTAIACLIGRLSIDNMAQQIRSNPNILNIILLSLNLPCWNIILEHFSFDVSALLSKIDKSDVMKALTSDLLLFSRIVSWKTTVSEWLLGLMTDLELEGVCYSSRIEELANICKTLPLERAKAFILRSALNHKIRSRESLLNLMCCMPEQLVADIMGQFQKSEIDEIIKSDSDFIYILKEIKLYRQETAGLYYLILGIGIETVKQWIQKDISVFFRILKLLPEEAAKNFLKLLGSDFIMQQLDDRQITLSDLLIKRAHFDLIIEILENAYLKKLTITVSDLKVIFERITLSRVPLYLQSFTDLEMQGLFCRGLIPGYRTNAGSNLRLYLQELATKIFSGESAEKGANLIRVLLTHLDIKWLAECFVEDMGLLQYYIDYLPNQKVLEIISHVDRHKLFALGGMREFNNILTQLDAQNRREIKSALLKRVYLAAYIKLIPDAAERKAHFTNTVFDGLCVMTAERGVTINPEKYKELVGSLSDLLAVFDNLDEKTQELLISFLTDNLAEIEDLCFSSEGALRCLRSDFSIADFLTVISFLPQQSSDRLKNTVLTQNNINQLICSVSTLFEYLRQLQDSKIRIIFKDERFVNCVFGLINNLNRLVDLLEIIPEDVAIDLIKSQKDSVIEQIWLLTINRWSREAIPSFIRDMSKTHKKVLLTLAEKLSPKTLISCCPLREQRIEYFGEEFNHYLESHHDKECLSAINTDLMGKDSAVDICDIPHGANINIMFHQYQESNNTTLTSAATNIVLARPVRH